MEENEKFPKTNESKELETIASKNKSSIFSQEEIRTIVKEFISAYIRGDVTIAFLSAEELMDIAKRTGKRLDLHKAFDQEVETKQPVLELIAICAGTEEASSAQKTEAINNLFKVILLARSSKRMKGKFMTFDIEARLTKLEHDLNQTNKLVDELLIAVRSLLEKK